jgi:hypothetical protein
MRLRGIVITLATALVAVALLFAACGGDEEPEETTTNSPPAAEAPDSGTISPSLSRFPPEFLECLEDQGIDLESVTDVSAAIHSPGGNQCFDELHAG